MLGYGSPRKLTRCPSRPIAQSEYTPPVPGGCFAPASYLGCGEGEAQMRQCRHTSGPWYILSKRQQLLPELLPVLSYFRSCGKIAGWRLPLFHPASSQGCLFPKQPRESLIHSFLFFYFFWLRWVFVAVRRLPLVAASRGYSSLWCAGFSWWYLLLLRSMGSRCAGSVVVAHGLSCSTACGIFRTRAQTCVPCIGRWILNHCATREVPDYSSCS